MKDASWKRLQKQLCTAVQTHKPRVPDAGRLFWSWFVQLSDARTYHQTGANPLSHTEIQAWAMLHRIPIEGRHVELLRAMDRAWLSKSGNVTSPPPPAPKLTAAAFDAVFG